MSLWFRESFNLDVIDAINVLLFSSDLIHQDVLRTSGQFYLRNQPSNNDIDTILQMQADNARSFMTPTIDGGFIHAPVP